MAAPLPQEAELVSALGFSGKVQTGLVAHPNEEDIIYALGNTIVIKNVRSGKQTFLHGHSDLVTCLTLSKDGSTIASGQKTHIGFQAPIILWDFELAKEDPKNAMAPLKDFHKQKVQSLSFSPSGKCLASVGGTDDNQLALWNVATGKLITSSRASDEAALTVEFYENDENKLVTGGFYHIRRWELQPVYDSYKLDYKEANLGTLRRVVHCLAMTDDDRSVFAGTATGDVLKVDVAADTPTFKTNANELYRKGIRSMTTITAPGGKRQLLIGCGNGDLNVLDARTLRKEQTAECLGEVTSIAPIRSAGSSPQDFVTQLYVGTNESNMYFVSDIQNISTKTKLLASCHYSGINDAAFLQDCDSIFVTCSTHDIRVWDATKQQELLRIRVPNVTCNSICLPRSGELILSAWSDGRVRAFKPVSGKLQFVINDAHPDGATAVAISNDGETLITGGTRGHVRFWNMNTRKMISSLKEHKGAVTSIAVRPDDRECVSSSDDGSCIMWDMISHRRSTAMLANTMFKSVLYHPDESQLVTCGSDRNLTYWCATEGNEIRILEASTSQINSLSIDNEGAYFACGGKAAQLKLFSYDDGELCAVGNGHSGAINSIKISPEQRNIVSVGSEGAIFIWKYPFGAYDSRDESKHK